MAKFAYIDKNGGEHLPIGDAAHAKMAVEAVTTGFRGNKADIPSDEIGGVKAKIRAALHEFLTGDELKEWLGKLGGSSSKDAGPLKALAVDESGDVTRVGGYLVSFGDAATKDLTGEYFTPDTDFALDMYPARPALYQHGLDKKVGYSIVGTIDKLEQDDVGLWAEAQLNKANAYAAGVQKLIKAGRLAWSSGTLAHLMKKAPDGRIVKWPLVEGSLTTQPAEPRGNWVAGKTMWPDLEIIGTAYKALNLPTDALQPESITESGLQTAGDTQTTAPNNSTNGDFSMDEKDIKALSEGIAGAVVAGLKPALEALKPAAPPEPPSQPTKSLPEDDRAAQIPASTKSTGQITYQRDRRYADWSPEDMSCWNQVARQLVALHPGSNEPAVATARKAVSEWDADTDRKFERQLAVKSYQWTARKWSDDSILDAVPFKSMEDAALLKFDESMKSNELDSTGQSTFGAEWVPAIWANDILRRIRIANPVASQLMQVNMPTNPFYYPIESTDPTVYNVAEATDAAQLVLGASNTITLSKPATNKLTLTAKKLGARVAFSTELNEDSIVAVMPQFRYQIVRALMNYVDDTILNGDTAAGASANVNLIDGTPTTGVSYLNQDGMRKYALVTNTGQGVDLAGTLTVALIRKVRFKLAAQYALDLPNLVLVTDPFLLPAFLNLPEFVTMENSGQAPTASSGVLPGYGGSQVEQAPRQYGVVDGMPVYVSAQLGQTQASGKISGTPANNIKSQFLIFHRMRWLIGYRRQVSFEQANFPFFSDTIQMQATVRFAITSFDATSLAEGYDITTP